MRTSVSHSTRRFGARSKRAQLTSPVLTAVDRAPCSPTPSGAFIAVASSLAHLARTRAHLFHPRRFCERVAKRWGRLPAPGRAPCRLRTTRTDAPRPTRIPYTSAGAPRASHDRPRTTDGRRAPRTEVRPARELFPSPPHATAHSNTSFFSHPRRVPPLPRRRAPVTSL